MTSPLVVGVPREVKTDEHRVAITPDGVAEMQLHGVSVLVEHDAGTGSGITDDDYREAGAEIVATAADVWNRAGLVIKVKEPQKSELVFLRPGLVLFTYLHLAAYPEIARALLESHTTGIGYETVQLPSGQLPLLAPMSEVAGRMSVQIGARYLEAPNGGRGVLLGGIPGVRPGNVVILGGGVVGHNAAKIAVGMGARVTIIDRNLNRLRELDDIYNTSITTMASNAWATREALRDADLVIGAVLIPGASAPRLVRRDMLPDMRRGAVMVDVSIDQGGCFETSHATTHTDPVYFVDHVLHYCVSNMPAAVPHTSTFALTNATFPYLLELANHGLEGACERHAALAGGVNTYDGRVTHAGVAESQGREWRALGAVG